MSSKNLPLVNTALQLKLVRQGSETGKFSSMQDLILRKASTDVLQTFTPIVTSNLVTPQ